MKLKIRGLVFVGFAAAVFAQSALAVDADDKTVTSKTYVDSKIEASVGGETTIGPSSPEDKAPSSQNVYLALQEIETAQGNFQRKLVNGVDEKVPHIGMLVNTADSGETPVYQSDWQSLSGEGYVALQTNNAGTGWDIKIPATEVASSATTIAGSGGNGPASTDSSDLTTAKAVYDFVTGTGSGDGFQPKTHVDATNGEANNSLKFGMGEGQWGVIRAYGQTSPGQTANSYLHIQAESERDTYSIGINPNKIAQHGVAGTDAGGSYSNQIVADSPSLATANSVFEYAVKQHWDSTNDAGKHLIVGNDGVVTLSANANPDIPAPTDSRCAQAGGTHVCALVAYWGAAVGTQGDDDYVPAGVRYEWTVMAPTGN